MKDESPAPEKTGMRLDKWLWAARFYKTRGLATEEIGKGRVDVNGLPAKPAKEVHPGDRVELRQGPVRREVKVVAISHTRGPAPVAQALYQETEESARAREAARQAQRHGIEPSMSIEHGRPTKRDRRQLDEAQRQGWGDRWSASIDDDTPPRK